MSSVFAERPTLQIVHRAGILDLGWGHPDPVLLDTAGLQAAAEQTLTTYGPIALGYGYEHGPAPLLAQIAARIAAAEGRAPQPGEIMATAGNSHALDLLCTICTRPGDTLLVAEPTYHLAVRILRDHPLDLVPVPGDAGGVDIAALETTLARLAAAGKQPRALYSIPTFANPTGISLADDRRRALADLAVAHDLLIFEDDVYRELAFDAPAPASLWSMAPGQVVRMGSFSKSLAPGLRLGYLTAPAPIISALTGSGVLDSGGGVNHFTALLVATYMANGGYAAGVERLRAAYRERRDALCDALEARLPAGCQVRRPAGGFFVWVDLPPGTDLRTLGERAEAQGVAYLPGSKFFLAGGGNSALRLSFSLYAPAQLVEAAHRLGRALG